MTRRDFISTTTATLCLTYNSRAAVFPPRWLDTVVSIGEAVIDVSSGQGRRKWQTHATGFLFGSPISRVEGQDHRYFIYLVTARHVVQGRPQIMVRFNAHEGVAKEFPIPLQGTDTKAVFVHPDVDIAVVLLNFSFLHGQDIDPAYFVPENLASRSSLANLGVSAGDTVFTLGFPLGISAEERNTVIAKHGSIALLPEPSDAGEAKEYLVDALIFPGNSGGPVITKPELGGISGTKVADHAYLLGVVTGFLPYIDTAISQQTGRARITFEENSGVTQVVPADFITDAIARQRRSMGV